MSVELNRAMLQAVLDTLGLDACLSDPAIIIEDEDVCAYWVGSPRSLTIGVDDGGVYYILVREGAAIMYPGLVGLVDAVREFESYIRTGIEYRKFNEYMENKEYLADQARSAGNEGT